MIRNNLSGGNTMQRKALHLLGLTMLLSPAAQTVNASTILVGAPNPLGSFFYGLYSDYAHAAEFTLADSYNVSTIEVMLRTPSTTSFNTFDFSLQDSLTSPSTIFASAALTAPLGTVSTQVMNVNRTLPAGTYYLQVLIPGYYPTPVIPNDVNGWMLSDRDYIQAAGTVADGLWFLSGSSPSFSSGEINGYSYYAPVFTVNGDPVVVPLPAALYLFGAGLVGLVGIARRGKTT